MTYTDDFDEGDASAGSGNGDRNQNINNNFTNAIRNHINDENLCPRNREEAVIRGRTCLRKCNSDLDCISSRKRCLCDGLCGWSCVRPGMCVWYSFFYIFYSF